MPGWLPIEIVLDRYPTMVWPGLDEEASVRWMHFGERRLSEPFFSQTVAHLRARASSVLEMDTAIDAITRQAAQGQRLTPNGFIFHMSRCGSTLISNAIKVFKGVQVVAEAPPLTRLFMPCRPSGEPTKGHEDGGRRELGESLFSLFSCYRTGIPEQIVIKFASQNSICLPEIRRLWPDVPCLFVIRDPIQVMVSNLKDRGLEQFREAPAVAYEICGADRSSPLSEISVEDFAGRVIGRYLDAAIGEIGSKVRVIDYDHVNPSSIFEIAEFFRLDPPSDPAPLVEVFKQYSKDYTGKKLFFCDRAEKLGMAGPRIMSAASRWASFQYGKLRAASRWS
jgi:hypothetical protein